MEIEDLRGGPAVISDKKVVEKTGKTSEEWYDILDKFGGKEKNYYELRQYLHQEQGLNPWWSNVMAIRYEYVRRKRLL